MRRYLLQIYENLLNTLSDAASLPLSYTLFFGANHPFPPRPWFWFPSFGPNHFTPHVSFRSTQAALISDTRGHHSGFHHCQNVILQHLIRQISLCYQITEPLSPYPRVCLYGRVPPPPSSSSSPPSPPLRLSNLFSREDSQ